MTEYITSDTHFNHRSFVGDDSLVSTRKHFKDINDMNQTIINEINSVVKNNDTLYHLGDISLGGKPADVLELLRVINGQLIIVKGNHDNSKLLKYLEKNNYKLPNDRDKFIIHQVGTIIKRNGKAYYLTHYPMNIGEGRENLRTIHGHIHEHPSPYLNGLNVGIDSPELPGDEPFGKPIKLEDAMEILEHKRNGIGINDTNADFEKVEE